MARASPSRDKAGSGMQGAAHERATWHSGVEWIGSGREVVEFPRLRCSLAEESRTLPTDGLLTGNLAQSQGAHVGHPLRGPWQYRIFFRTALKPAKVR